MTPSISTENVGDAERDTNMDEGDSQTEDITMDEKQATPNEDWDMEPQRQTKEAQGHEHNENAHRLSPDTTEDGVEQAMAKILKEKGQQEKEKMAIRRRLKWLDSKIRELDRLEAAASNKSCPVLLLPTRITIKIFLYSQDPYAIAGSLRQPRPFSELSISHVCRKWRKIALNCPTLWAMFRYDAHKALHVPLERFKIYLQRSAKKPLMLWLNFTEVDHDEIDCEDHLDLFEEAIKHVRRWKRITVISDTETPLLSARAKLEWAPAPFLEYFAFISNDRNENINYPGSLDPTIFKNGAPNLRSVVLDISIGQGIIPPLFHNITSLCLQNMDSAEARHFNFASLSFGALYLILTVPWLTNLSIRGLVCNSLPSTSGVIVMPSLRNLRFCNSLFLPKILPFLNAPLLETLFIKDESLEEFGLGLPDLTSFSSLHSLYLVETPVSPAAAQYLARMTPMLSAITVVHRRFETSIFALFMRSTPFHWPLLGYVVLDLELSDHLADLIHFTEFRRDSGLVLRVRESIFKKWHDTLRTNPTYALRDLKHRCRLEITWWSDFSPTVWREHWRSIEWVAGDQAVGH